jgi:hypothetical protein
MTHETRKASRRGERRPLLAGRKNLRFSLFQTGNTTPITITTMKSASFMLLLVSIMALSKLSNAKFTKLPNARKWRGDNPESDVKGYKATGECDGKRDGGQTCMVDSHCCSGNCAGFIFHRKCKSIVDGDVPRISIRNNDCRRSAGGGYCFRDRQCCSENCVRDIGSLRRLGRCQEAANSPSNSPSEDNGDTSNVDALTSQPTTSPTSQPTVGPTSQPTAGPTSQPTVSPAPSASSEPSSSPSISAAPSSSSLPSSASSFTPSVSSAPSYAPSEIPSVSSAPSSTPSEIPSVSSAPSSAPSPRPSVSIAPTSQPSLSPSSSSVPSFIPSAQPSASSAPSSAPSSEPSVSVTV